MPVHSKFSPSSAGRWINCPGSIKVTRSFKESSSLAALQGTAAHWLYEHCITKKADAKEFIGNSLTATSDDGSLTKQFEIDADFARHVQIMLDYCRTIMQTPGRTGVEVKLDLSHIEPGFFGYGDFVHNSALTDGVLTVVDFKFGLVDVEVKKNLQLYCYAVGALNGKSPEAKQVKHVRLCIIQPRSIAPGPRIKDVVVPVEEIKEFERTLAYAIGRTKEEVPSLKWGGWCRYCPALGLCPETTEMLKSVGLALAFEPASATGAQISLLFQTKKLVDRVMKRVEHEARNRLLAKKPIPNLMLVTGVKYRQWHDENLAASLLKEALGEQSLRPKTPAQVEKMGTEAKKLVDTLSSAPTGDPVVAVIGDKRKPFTTRSAADIFK